MSRMPTWFLSHGGGPWPWVDGLREAHAGLAASLREIRRTSPAPSAVLIATAHWEESAFTFSSAAKPGMIYDYGGFPPHTYAVRYPAPGHPELSARAADLLRRHGLEARLDGQRGYDHGTFVPLSVMWPEADIPVVQMSMRSDLDPQAHLAAGRALSALRQEGVLILGSGLSFHNLRLMGPAGRGPSQTFDTWLEEVVACPDPHARNSKLLDWAGAPAARSAHPREEHLLPLLVAAGAAQEDLGSLVWRENDVLGGWTVSNHRFG